MAGELSFKCVVLGDCDAGKTSLIETFLSGGQFPTIIRPSSCVFERNNAQVELKNGDKITMDIWDTNGSDVYEKLRGTILQDVRLISQLCYYISNSLK